MQPIQKENLNNKQTSNKVYIGLAVVFGLVLLGVSGFMFYYFFIKNDNKTAVEETVEQEDEIDETTTKTNFHKKNNKPKTTTQEQENKTSTLDDKPSNFKNKDERYKFFQKKYNENKDKNLNLASDPLDYYDHVNLYLKDDLQKQLSFHQLIGMKQEQEILKQFIAAVNMPSELAKYGMSPLNGLLMYGPHQELVKQHWLDVSRKN